jgi:hypothetical protein
MVVKPNSRNNLAEISSSSEEKSEGEEETPNLTENQLVATSQNLSIKQSLEKITQPQKEVTFPFGQLVPE